MNDTMNDTKNDTTDDTKNAPLNRATPGQATDPTTEATGEHTRPLARLDALLGARQDGLLDGAEAAELEALLAGSEQARARARAFEAVDSRLLALAAEPLASARLEANLSTLRTRLRSAATPAPVVPLRRRVVARWAGAALALAAGLLAALLLLPRDPEPTVDPIGSVVSLVDADLEVIEELELLEFLAARERGAEAPRG